MSNRKTKLPRKITTNSRSTAVIGEEKGIKKKENKESISFTNAASKWKQYLNKSAALSSLLQPNTSIKTCSTPNNYSNMILQSHMDDLKIGAELSNSKENQISSDSLESKLESEIKEETNVVEIPGNSKTCGDIKSVSKWLKHKDFPLPILDNPDSSNEIETTENIIIDQKINNDITNKNKKDSCINGVCSEQKVNKKILNENKKHITSETINQKTNKDASNENKGDIMSDMSGNSRKKGINNNHKQTSGVRSKHLLTKITPAPSLEENNPKWRKIDPDHQVDNKKEIPDNKDQEDKEKDMIMKIGILQRQQGDIMKTLNQKDNYIEILQKNLLNLKEFVQTCKVEMAQLKKMYNTTVVKTFDQVVKLANENTDLVEKSLSANPDEEKKLMLKAMKDRCDLTNENILLQKQIHQNAEQLSFLRVEVQNVKMELLNKDAVNDKTKEDNLLNHVKFEDESRKFDVSSKTVSSPIVGCDIPLMYSNTSTNSELTSVTMPSFSSLVSDLEKDSEFSDSGGKINPDKTNHKLKLFRTSDSSPDHKTSIGIKSESSINSQILNELHHKVNSFLCDSSINKEELKPTTPKNVKKKTIMKNKVIESHWKKTIHAANAENKKKSKENTKSLMGSYINSVFTRKEEEKVKNSWKPNKEVESASHFLKSPMDKSIVSKTTENDIKKLLKLTPGNEKSHISNLLVISPEAKRSKSPTENIFFSIPPSKSILENYSLDNLNSGRTPLHSRQRNKSVSPLRNQSKTPLNNHHYKNSYDFTSLSPGNSQVKVQSASPQGNSLKNSVEYAFPSAMRSKSPLNYESNRFLANMPKTSLEYKCNCSTVTKSSLDSHSNRPKSPIDYKSNKFLINRSKSPLENQSKTPSGVRFTKSNENKTCSDDSQIDKSTLDNKVAANKESKKIYESLMLNSSLDNNEEELLKNIKHLSSLILQKSHEANVSQEEKAKATLEKENLKENEIPSLKDIVEETKEEKYIALQNEENLLSSDTENLSSPKKESSFDETKEMVYDRVITEGLENSPDQQNECTPENNLSSKEELKDILIQDSSSSKSDNQSTENPTSTESIPSSEKSEKDNSQQINNNEGSDLVIKEAIKEVVEELSHVAKENFLNTLETDVPLQFLKKSSASKDYANILSDKKWLHDEISGYLVKNFKALINQDKMSEQKSKKESTLESNYSDFINLITSCSFEKSEPFSEKIEPEIKSTSEEASEQPNTECKQSELGSSEPQQCKMALNISTNESFEETRLSQDYSVTSLEIQSSLAQKHSNENNAEYDLEDNSAETLIKWQYRVLSNKQNNTETLSLQMINEQENRVDGNCNNLSSSPVNDNKDSLPFSESSLPQPLLHSEYQFQNSVQKCIPSTFETNNLDSQFNSYSHSLEDTGTEATMTEFPKVDLHFTQTSASYYPHLPPIAPKRRQNINPNVSHLQSDASEGAYYFKKKSEETSLVLPSQDVLSINYSTKLKENEKYMPFHHRIVNENPDWKSVQHGDDIAKIPPNVTHSVVFSESLPSINKAYDEDDTVQCKKEISQQNYPIQDWLAFITSSSISSRQGKDYEAVYNEKRSEEAQQDYEAVYNEKRSEEAQQQNDDVESISETSSFHQSVSSKHSCVDNGCVSKSSSEQASTTSCKPYIGDHTWKNLKTTNKNHCWDSVGSGDSFGKGYPFFNASPVSLAENSINSMTENYVQKLLPWCELNQYQEAFMYPPDVKRKYTNLPDNESNEEGSKWKVMDSYSNEPHVFCHRDNFYTENFQSQYSFRHNNLNKSDKAMQQIENYNNSSDKIKYQNKPELQNRVTVPISITRSPSDISESSTIDTQIFDARKRNNPLQMSQLNPFLNSSVKNLSMPIKKDNFSQLCKVTNPVHGGKTANEKKISGQNNYQNYSQNSYIEADAQIPQSVQKNQNQSIMTTSENSNYKQYKPEVRPIKKCNSGSSWVTLCSDEVEEHEIPLVREASWLTVTSSDEADDLNDGQKVKDSKSDSFTTIDISTAEESISSVSN